MTPPIMAKVGVRPQKKLKIPKIWGRRETGGVQSERTPPLKCDKPLLKSIFNRRIIVQGVEDSLLESLKIAVPVSVLFNDFYP